MKTLTVYKIFIIYGINYNILIKLINLFIIIVVVDDVDIFFYFLKNFNLKFFFLNV